MTYQIIIPIEDIVETETVWIDGVEYSTYKEDDKYYIDLDNLDAKVLTIYFYHQDDPEDIYTQYPIGMQVWLLEVNDEKYIARHVPWLDNILNFAGYSIRESDMGIRQINAIDEDKKETLVSNDLLMEYGAAIAWAGQLGKKRPLVLGKSYVNSNYAYKKGVANPIFGYSREMQLYTNVITNFSPSQTNKDFSMRPYIILTINGTEIIIYGAITTRKIIDFFLKNRNTYTPGSEEYEYIWETIRTVHGDVYDNDYVTTQPLTN